MRITPSLFEKKKEKIVENRSWKEEWKERGKSRQTRTSVLLRKELVQLTKPLKQESFGIIICISFSKTTRIFSPHSALFPSVVFERRSPSCSISLNVVTKTPA